VFCLFEHDPEQDKVDHPDVTYIKELNKWTITITNQIPANPADYDEH